MNTTSLFIIDAGGVFERATLEAALADWTQAQADAYPHREEFISVVAAAVREFLDSPQAEARKMMLK